MDPVTLFLLTLALSAWITKVIQDGLTEREYARQGLISPRQQIRLERLRRGGIAAPDTGRGPMRDFLAAVWADVWLGLASRYAAGRAGQTVQQRIQQLRARWGTPADPTPAGDQPDPDPVDDPPPPPPPPPPAKYEPGTWTISADGKRVELAPPATPDPAKPARQPLPAQEGPDMDTVTNAPAEVHTNEDVRNNMAAVLAAAQQATDAIALLEAAGARMAAAGNATLDGVDAKKFDAAATVAASEAAQAIAAIRGVLANLGEPLDVATGAAQASIDALDKYQDSEAQVAAENIDPTTLAASSK